MTPSTTEETLTTVRSYHRGWSTKRFEQSIALLSPALVVEVPVNDYPTTASFAQALAGFGGMVQRVDLLAELAAGEEAMILYDLEVAQLGRLRVAEHFTVRDRQIVRLRQIHDTAPIRAAGLARSFA